MPSCPLTFRGVCGRFAVIFEHFMFERVLHYRKYYVSTVKLRSLRLSFAVVFIISTLLLRSGVEPNPGPQMRSAASSSRQNKLPSTNRSFSADGAADRSPSGRETEREPSLSDVMTQLKGMSHEMNQRFDTMNNQFDSLNDSVTGLRQDVTQLAEEVECVKNENEQLRFENRDLTRRLEEAENKLDDLEGRSKRNNLIFSGLKKRTGTEYESWDDCEKLVKDVIKDQLKIDDDMQFDRVHRLGKDPNSPIVARFTSFKDKERVLREKRKLRESENGKSVFVGEDFSKGVREIRRKLVPFLKKAKSEKKKASMVFDHLIVEGKKLFFDSASGTLKESK